MRFPGSATSRRSVGSLALISDANAKRSTWSGCTGSSRFFGALGVGDGAGGGGGVLDAGGGASCSGVGVLQADSSTQATNHTRQESFARIGCRELPEPAAPMPSSRRAPVTAAS